MKKQIPAQYRHGDVLIQRRKGRVPSAAQPLSHLTLAEGEATGHSHTLIRPTDQGGPGLFERDGRLWFRGGDISANPPDTAKLFEHGDDKILRVESQALLAHHEHAVISLPSGSYDVIHQREYQPAAPPRRVVD